MEKDFYLHDRGLASYLEKDWFDKILKTKEFGKPNFTFARFDPLYLYSNYHEQQIDFLKSELSKLKILPQTMLEVGSSLGRTFYEVCNKMPSIKSTTLIEPSQNLSTAFHKIFSGQDIESFSILQGNIGTEEITLDTKPIREVCAKVQMTQFNCTFQDAPKNLGQFDLVICANVIDQCQDHLKLVEFLKTSVNPGGLLLLSCTYQWQNKYIGNAGYQIKDINELFDSRWMQLNQTNIPFQCRVNERHWLNFMSHVGVFQKLPN